MPVPKHSIVAETKAGIQADLDAAIAKADEEIAAKAAEGEKVIADIVQMLWTASKLSPKTPPKKLCSYGWQGRCQNPSPLLVHRSDERVIRCA